MNLLEMQEAAASAVNSEQDNHSILLYGAAKTGKTRLVGTAAKIPEIKRIFWFDTENGVATLLNMGLTPEELAKVTVYKIRDTREEPFAIETMLKAFATKKSDGVKICNKHGRVDCPTCLAANPKGAFTPFNLKTLTHSDLVVIDSGSQLGDSALNCAMLGQPVEAKPTFNEYGECGRYLSDVLSVVQAATYTNFVVITHEIHMEDDEDKDKVVPLIGTKNFSLKVAKYFGTVIYVHKKMNAHTAGSGSTYRGDLMTGSRLNIAIEHTKGEKTMHDILVAGGVLRPANESATVEPSTPTTAPAQTAAVVKPMTLAERLKAKQQTA